LRGRGDVAEWPTDDTGIVTDVDTTEALRSLL